MPGVEGGSVRHLVSFLEMVVVKATLGRRRDGGGGSQLQRKMGKNPVNSPHLLRGAPESCVTVNSNLARLDLIK